MEMFWTMQRVEHFEANYAEADDLNFWTVNWCFYSMDNFIKVPDIFIFQFTNNYQKLFWSRFLPENLVTELR